MQKYRESFAVSELGRIYAQLPLKEIAENIRSHFHKTHHQGNNPLFPPEGEGGADVRLSNKRTAPQKLDKKLLECSSLVRQSRFDKTGITI